MAFVITNLPSDITQYIDDLTNDLIIAERKRKSIKTISEQCVETIKTKFQNNVETYHLRLSEAWLNMHFGDVDHNHHHLEILWNNFVDHHQHFDHLLEPSQIQYFRKY